MMLKQSIVVLTLGAAMLSGCATPLALNQKQELAGYRAKGMAIEEKDPGTAAALGILPGVGSFYTGNIGPGIISVLFWPASILWDPVSGYDGAESRNYYATKVAVDAKKRAELRELDQKLLLKTITMDEYLIKKNQIEDKYAPI